MECLAEDVQFQPFRDNAAEMIDTAGSDSHTFEYIQLTEEEAAEAEKIIRQVRQEEPIDELQSYLRDAGETETLKQSHRVAVAAVTIARRLRLPQDLQKILAGASLVHDIGKYKRKVRERISEPRQFEGKARARAMAVIKPHPKVGAKLIRDSTLSDQIKGSIVAITAGHHMLQKVRYGVRPKGNMFWAEIVAFSDKLDALASPRPGRGAYSAEETKAQLEAEHVGGYYKALLMRVCFENFSVPDYASVAGET